MDLPAYEQRLNAEREQVKTQAGERFGRGERAGLFGLILSPPLTFWRVLIVQGAMLRGWSGWIEANTQANRVRQKAVMLWMLARGQRLD